MSPLDPIADHRSTFELLTTMSAPNLFTSLSLGPLSLPNRMAMSPMTRGRAPDLHANALMAEYYSQRACAGLIITEGTHVSIPARGWFHVPEIFTPQHAAAWNLVTVRVHENGERIFCQLWHVGRAGHSSFRDGVSGYEGEKRLPVAPSAIIKPSKSGLQHYTNVLGDVKVETPRELSTEEADKIPEEFRNAAEMAKMAAFDGVEIYAAGGYLLDTFLQSSTNKRVDKYEGSVENRYRMLDLVVQAVLQVFEPCQVGIKISPNGDYNSMGSVDFRETFLYTAKQLAKYNLGYIM